MVESSRLVDDELKRLLEESDGVLLIGKDFTVGPVKQFGSGTYIVGLAVQAGRRTRVFGLSVKEASTLAESLRKAAEELEIEWRQAIQFGPPPLGSDEDA